MRDLFKGMVLYGSVNWRRASDGLQPPRLSPVKRKIAMPTPESNVIKPRHNPQAALIKTVPKKQAPSRDVTAGAIVSDPLFDAQELASVLRRMPVPPSVVEEAEQTAQSAAETIIVRRRRRHSRHGVQAKRAPRSVVQYSDATRPGFFARFFGLR